ncbi:hypothetical protein TWF481_005277 [Arthrobotrys musiformis]|uniref:Uncharacterized protein n=1 Tax=Arthrobotrys musiformis TaxID=47236 RepID=A0AAV9WDA1_9PEZI
MENDIFAKAIKPGTPLSFSRKVWGAILILFLLLWVSLCVIGAILDRFHRDRSKHTRGRVLRPSSIYTYNPYSQGFGSVSPTLSSRSESTDIDEYEGDFEKAEADGSAGGKKKVKKVRFKLPRKKQQSA